MRNIVEAVHTGIQTGKMDRRTFLTAGALGLAGVFVSSELAKGAEVRNDFKNLTFLIRPSPFEVRIQSGTFWDVSEADTDASIKYLQMQIITDAANRRTPQNGLDVPVIIPTDSSGAHVALQGRVRTRAEAAARFGVIGSRSRSADSWDMNQFGQAVLKPASDGRLTRIYSGAPNGAVIDTVYNSRNGLQGVILRPELGESEISSGTFWEFGTNKDLGVRQIVRGQMARGLSPYVMYAVRHEGPPKPVGLERKFQTKRELVDRFGVPGEWSSRFDAWDINVHGGATLWPNPNGTLTRVKHNGAVVEVRGS